MDYQQTEGAVLRTPSPAPAAATAAAAPRQHPAAAGQQQPPREEPPTQRQQPRPLARRIEQAAGVYAVFAQAVMWNAYASSGLAPAGHARQAAMCAINAIFLLQALYLPHALWMRIRVAIITISRIAAVLVGNHPSTIGGGGAHVPVLLRHAASPYWWGAVVDYSKLGLGMGMLPHTCSGTLLPQPLLAVLLQQAAIMFMISTAAPEYCATPLLTDPLSQQRISRVAGVLDALPSLLPAHMPAMTGKEGRDAAHACVAVLTFHNLVLGVLPPLLCQAFTQGGFLPPPPPPPHAAPQRQPARWRRAVAAVHRAWRAADAALTELCSGVDYEGLHLGLFLYLALGLVWTVASAAGAAPHPAASAA